LDTALQQAQLTTLDNAPSGKRVAMKGYVNRLQARCELVYSQISMKVEHFEEVDNVWQSFFQRFGEFLLLVSLYGYFVLTRILVVFKNQIQAEKHKKPNCI